MTVLRRAHAMTGAARSRGFSLIELLIALAAAGVVLTAVMGLISTTTRAERRGRALAHLSREGNFTITSIRQAIQRAGVGVPTGLKLTDTANNTEFAPVLVAAPTALLIVGDAPRPHGQYATFGVIHGVGSDSTLKLTWHTENNGSCAPRNNGASCSTATTSQFFPGITGCNGTTNFGDRTCPWGLRRAEANEWLVVAAGTGEWTISKLKGTMSEGPAPERIYFADLLPQFAAGTSGFDDDTTAPTWTNTAGSPPGPPAGIVAVNFVSTIDRVMFWYDAPGQRLLRMQCWGRADPTSANWPQATATALPANPLAVNADTECTGTEPILNDVAGVRFDYFDALGNPIVNPNTLLLKRSIRRVDITIWMRATFWNETLEHYAVTTAAVRNTF